MTSKNRNKALLIIAVIIIIAIILLYFVSLGKINLADRGTEEEDSKTKRKRWIDERLKSLHYQAKSKAELKEKLDHKVKRYFLYTRISFVILYLGINCTFYFFVLDSQMAFDDKISVLLNYNQLALIAILIFLFIRFETSAEFKDVFKLIHLFIIKIIYKNHKGLDSDLEFIHSEIAELQKEKDDLESDK